MQYAARATVVCFEEFTVRAQALTLLTPFRVLLDRGKIRVWGRVWSGAAHFIIVPLLGYFLTFSTYGTHLPGSAKGSVDREHCRPGTPILAENATDESYWRAHLNEPPFLPGEDARSLTLAVVRGVCEYRKWLPFAVHVRTSHVRVVVGGDGKPEKMVADFKAFATRALRSAKVESGRRRYWTDHGSTRYLWNEVSVGRRLRMFWTVREAIWRGIRRARH